MQYSFLTTPSRKHHRGEYELYNFDWLASSNQDPPDEDAYEGTKDESGDSPYCTIYCSGGSREFPTLRHQKPEEAPPCTRMRRELKSEDDIHPVTIHHGLSDFLKQATSLKRQPDTLYYFSVSRAASILLTVATFTLHPSGGAFKTELPS